MLIVLFSVGNTSCKENLVAEDSKTNIELNNNILIDWEDYVKGWKEGYCEGYKDVKGIGYDCPGFTPNPPNQFDQSKKNYKGGYNAGFKAGSKKARE